MLGEKSAETLKTVPLSNDSIRRRIFDISDDLQEQLIEPLTDKRFSLQFDEATDSNKDCLFIAYVRFDISASLCEDLLFCKYVQTRATADELFKLLDGYLKEHGLKWENCVGICSDGVQTMAGTLWEWRYCIIHRKALASWQLSTELNEVLTDVIVVNFIKTRPLKTRHFSALCEDVCKPQSCAISQ